MLVGVFMSFRDSYLYRVVCNKIQQECKYLPINMPNQEVFEKAKQQHIDDLKRMVEIAEKMDYETFKPYMRSVCIHQ